MNDPVQNQTWVFNYDRGGNIVSRVRYAYTIGTLGTALETIPYAYGDSNWKDKLTACNGKTITYDAIGNPLTFDGWTYTWQAGRQLAGMSKTGTTLAFEYDHNGLRTQKTVQTDWLPETTNYYLHGKLLTHMTVDYTDFDEVAHTDKLHFFYDAQSRPAQVNFNGTVYTYIHNLQGDIVGLLDSTGALVVEYKYDAWGKPLSVTGILKDTLGKRNPFRYRGYIYDEETGLYYLRSRYYNPEVGRFINADVLLGIHGELLSTNSYSYCQNAPIVQNDADGLVAFGSQMPSADVGFIPARGGSSSKVPSDFGYGWKDSEGNIWIPDSNGHGGDHRDVQRGDGKGYINVYPDGRRRSGKGKEPKLPPQKPQPNASPAPTPNPNKKSQKIVQPSPTPIIETIPAVQPKAVRSSVPEWIPIVVAVGIAGLGAAAAAIFGPVAGAALALA